MRVRFQLAAMTASIAALMSLASAGPQGVGAPHIIDEQKSSITIRVYKTGLFSALAHNHEIHAPIQQGTFDEQKSTVEFTVAAKELRVLDPDAPAFDRKKSQENMVGPKVLDADKFPEIKFHSTSVDPAGGGKWTVRGDLALHGQIRLVKVDVEGANGHYTGSATLKQTDFGITPIAIAGGAVRVKDEVRVEFEIFGK